MNNLMQNRQQAGSTMIEILIAILIFSVGLLGIASTQTMGLTNTQSALNRSVATQLSYDVIDIMRLNQDAVALGASASGGIFDGYQTVANDGSANPRQYAINADCSDATKGCDSSIMAQSELEAWRQKIVRSLPEGQARIQLTDPSQNYYRVTMTWVDIKSQSAIEANEADLTSNSSTQRYENIAGTDDERIFRFELDFRP